MSGHNAYAFHLQELAQRIQQSVERWPKLQKMTDGEIADLLLEVWDNREAFSHEADIIDQAIIRLRASHYRQTGEKPEFREEFDHE